MTGGLGSFFLGLVWDRLTGQADTPRRVQYRAAQLRCATNSWLVFFMIPSLSSSFMHAQPSPYFMTCFSCSVLTDISCRHFSTVFCMLCCLSSDLSLLPLLLDSSEQLLQPRHLLHFIHTLDGSQPGSVLHHCGVSTLHSMHTLDRIRIASFTTVEYIALQRNSHIPGALLCEGRAGVGQQT